MGSLLKPNLLDSDPWLWLSASTVGRGHPAAAGLPFGENPLVDKMIQHLADNHCGDSLQHLVGEYHQAGCQHQVDDQQLVGNQNFADS